MLLLSSRMCDTQKLVWLQHSILKVSTLEVLRQRINISNCMHNYISLHELTAHSKCFSNSHPKPKRENFLKTTGQVRADQVPFLQIPQMQSKIWSPFKIEILLRKKMIVYQHSKRRWFLKEIYIELDKQPGKRETLQCLENELFKLQHWKCFRHL